MNEFCLPLICIEGATLEIVWIDDSFRPNSAVLPPGGLTGGEMLFDADALRTFPAVRAMNDEDFQDRKAAFSVFKRLNQLYGVCIECGVNLTCVNFEWAEANIDEGVPDGKALLLDIQNSYVGTFDKDRMEGYGVDFAKRKGLILGQQNWRFFTRKPEQVGGKFGDDAPTDAQIFTRYTTTEDLKRWVESLNVSFHEDPKINRVIEMYSRPWRGKWQNGPYWHHDRLNEANSRYRELIASWLRVSSVESESAKCLCMYSRDMAPPWNLIDQPSLCISSREIDSTVLSKTLENLDIRVDAAIPNGQAWYLPVSPALSFLTALRAFVVKVNEDSPLKCLSLTRRDGDDYDVFLLRIEFEKRHKGKKAKELGLQEKYRLDTRGKSLQGVCKAFDDLVHCRTGEVCFTRIAEVVDKKELEAVFANGTPHPCVGVIFGKFGATLCWAGQPKDCENSE